MRNGITSEVDWVERYEALRVHALGLAQVDFVPLDLALLRHRGVVAWMAADVSSRQLLTSYKNGSGREERRAEAMPRTELVRVLAAMALLGSRRGAA